jgi:hypothetical protein
MFVNSMGRFDENTYREAKGNLFSFFQGPTLVIFKCRVDENFQAFCTVVK